jgi:hypothetical protein
MLPMKPTSPLAPDESMWQNGHYNAIVTPVDIDGVPMLILSFRRLDRRAVHDWRMVQRLKSELLGSDVEAAELYPHEERLLDGANQYHLWALPPGMLFAFGYEQSRSVMGQEEGIEAMVEAGFSREKAERARQREFAPGEKDVGRRVRGLVREMYPEWAAYGAAQEAKRANS